MAQKDREIQRPLRALLAGFMGAGKTSAGRELARLLRLPFRDTDEEIKRVSGLAAGTFIKRRGLAAFRRAEDAALRRLAAGGGAVIALGGGLYPSGRRLALLRRAGTTVWLRRPLAEMLRLAAKDGGRPLLAGGPGAAKKLYARRERFYARCSLKADISGLSPRPAAVKILKILRPLRRRVKK